MLRLNSQKLFKPLLFIAVILGLIFFNWLGWLERPKNIFYQLSTPIQRFTYSISCQVNNFFDFALSLKELDQENIKLKEENQRLQSEVVQLREVAQENQFLRQQLDLAEPIKQSMVLANVIGQDSQNLSQYIFIDKGQKDGIKKQAAVITAGNILIGQVLESFDQTAKVLLVIDQNSKVNALIQKSRISGLVKGEKGGLMLDLVPQEKEVLVGQTVVTSGLAGVFPKGLLIGQIKEVIISDPEVFQKIIIQPAADFERLEKVFVIE